MKIYAIEQSNTEVKKAYSLLIDKINEHVKLLALNSKPITSIIGIKRGLLRLKIGHIDTSTGSVRKNEIQLTEQLEILANDFMDKYQLDIKEIIDVGLVGEKEIIKALVRKEYNEMAKEGMKYKVIKAELSEKYGISVSSIEKLVYRNPLRPKGHLPGGEDRLTHNIKTEQDGNKG